MHDPVGSPSSLQRSSNRIDSFRHAFAGVWYVLRTQRNAWIHGAFSVAAVIVGAWLGLKPDAWALIAFAIGLVWVTEITNTAIEAAIDLASPAIHPLAKVGKDAAAAAVLVGAGTAVAVGLLVLGPPLVARVAGMIGAR